MKSKFILAGALVAGLGLASVPSQAAGMPIVSLPAAAQTSNFGAPYTIVQAGEEATYLNLDPTATHNVRSTATDNKKRAWCTLTQSQQGKCPLFHLKTLVDAGAQEAVPGTAQLPLGDYEFYCEPHPNMEGVLRIV